MTDKPVHLRLPREVSLRNLGEALAPAFDPDRSSASYHLDFRDVHRVGAHAGAVLTNLLLHHWRGHRVQVTGMRTQNGRSIFARVGLMYAIASREPEFTTYEGVDGLDVAFWRTPWTSGETYDYRRLFPPSDEELWDPDHGETGQNYPTVKGLRYVAAFVSPQLTVRAKDRASSNPVANRASPWIRTLVPSFKKLDNEAVKFLRAVTALIWEPLSNVAHHSGVRHDRPGGHCVLLLGVTLGGGVESCNRLSLLMHDTGRGVATTLRPKLMPSDREKYQHNPDEDLLPALVDRKLEPWDNMRGMGLADVKELTLKRGGSFFLATHRAAGDNAVMIRYGDNGLRAEALELPIRGTIIGLQTPLVAST